MKCVCLVRVLEQCTWEGLGYAEMWSAWLRSSSLGAVQDQAPESFLGSPAFTPNPNPDDRAF